MRDRRYTLACLAGNGVGPELMAEASRVLAAATRPHGVTLDEVHPPFGSEAFVRVGHPLPPSTRRVYREADAVLVAGADPAVGGVEADLDLTTGIARVLLPGRLDLCLVSYLGGSDEWTVERAFELACTRRGRLAVVANGGHLSRLVGRFADDSPGLHVAELSRPRALAHVAARAERFDVVLSDHPLAEALAHTVAFGAAGRTAAFGRLSPEGPGLFFPDHGADDEDAGQGTADPGPVLLAAALALGDGLGERAAARTLEGALAAASLDGGRLASTRERADAVLAALPSRVANAEFFQGAA
jgi:3-isopropylmalate dehydrogenase